MIRQFLSIILFVLFLSTKADDTNDCCILSQYHLNYAKASYQYLEKAFFLKKNNAWPGLHKYFFNLAQEKNYAADLISRFRTIKCINGNDKVLNLKRGTTEINEDNYNRTNATTYINDAENIEEHLLQLLKVKIFNIKGEHVKHFIVHNLLGYQYDRLYEVKSLSQKIRSLDTGKDSYYTIWDNYIITYARRTYDYKDFPGYETIEKS